MVRFKLFTSSILLVLSLFVPSYQVSATSPSLLINQILAGNPSAATQEFVSLYNNSDTAVEITNWCLSNKSQVSFACLASAQNVKVYVNARSNVTIASQAFVAAIPGNYDMVFPVTNQSSGSIIGSSDTISLIDAAGQVMDSHTWATSLTAGSIWQRNSVSPGVLQETDAAADFTKLTSLAIPLRGTYEVETIIDVCPNISGSQATIPAGLIIDVNGHCVTPPPVDVCMNIAGLQPVMPYGYMADEAGDCRQDACVNIVGLQVIVPSDYDSDETGMCVIHDECPNLSDNQITIPNGYKLSGNECVLDLLPLQLTEILPNAAGSDAGHEYIELYNPTDRPADLGLYRLYVGVNNEKSYEFPSGATLAPGEYIVFYDSSMQFSLVNTAGRVSVAGDDGTVIAQSDAYANPKDDQAWALINGVWQYTSIPTPGNDNVIGIEEEPVVDAEMLACPAGKYRHPLTNRCRNIEADAALATCDADQYRSPETGRCRKVITAGAMAPCKDGQYRSEETNRCRNITTASALAPCKEGQERNPDTNRCRNALNSTEPQAGYAVESVKDGAWSFMGWWALGGVGALALGYAGWEWRREVGNGIRKLGGIFSRGK